jgi:hypothetical protein
MEADVTRDQSAIPDLTLEQFRLGELPPDRAAAVGGRAAAEPGVGARLDALAASDAGIRGGADLQSLARSVADRLGDGQNARGWRPRWPAMVAAASAAAVLMALVAGGAVTRSRFWPGASNGPGVEPSGPDRIKGEAATLLVYRKAGASSERLTDGDAARAGDLLRVGYRASTPLFGVIVSIDGRGVVTRHLPTEGAAAAQLQAGAIVPLPEAYELDDAPRWERFFLVTSRIAFDAGPTLAAAERAAASALDGAESPATLSLPAGLDQSSFLLRKIP